MSTKKQAHIYQAKAEHESQAAARLAGPDPLAIDQEDPNAALLDLINQYNAAESERVALYAAIVRALAKRSGARLNVNGGKAPALNNRSAESLDMLAAMTLTVESLGSE